MTPAAKVILNDIREREKPGFVPPLGIITEQVAALLSYQMMLAMFARFRKSSSNDISMFDMVLAPGDNNSMNFSNLGTLWRDMLSKFKNNAQTFSISFLHEALGAAIKRIDRGAHGLALYERFVNKKSLKALQPKFSDWESEDPTRKEEIKKINIELLQVMRAGDHYTTSSAMKIR